VFLVMREPTTRYGAGIEYPNTEPINGTYAVVQVSPDYSTPSAGS